jgi:hypothetical protein
MGKSQFSKTSAMIGGYLGREVESSKLMEQISRLAKRNLKKFKPAELKNKQIICAL